MNIQTIFTLLVFCQLSVFAQKNQTDKKVVSNFHLTVKNAQGETIPSRVHLMDSKGLPVKPQGFISWNDHFVCQGNISLHLKEGTYQWTIERGPEYKSETGSLHINGDAHVLRMETTLKRITDLREEGWMTADMHVHRPPNDIQLLMQAEDLDFAPVITWWNMPQPNKVVLNKTQFTFGQNRVYEINAGEDEREGGALLYFGLASPLDLSVKSREFPSPMKFVGNAISQNKKVWIDIEKPFWWDVPVWLSSGKMHSIGIANNHMLRGGMLENEAWGKPRDRDRLPTPLGNGFWSQEIYYHILNSGLRVPPSAGSASGVLKNPVGYNRVYAYSPKDKGSFSRKRFFNLLERGQTFVTNGPLLRVFADGMPPGSEFEFGKQGKKTIDLQMDLDSNDHVRVIEVISNGRIIKTIPCPNYDPDVIGRHPQHESISTTLTLDQPGWFLIRAITDKKNTFRFASTAPFYVGKMPPHRDSVQFFLDWVDERKNRVLANLSDSVERKSVIFWHDKAKGFWKHKLATSIPTTPESQWDARARTFAAMAHSQIPFEVNGYVSDLSRVNWDASHVDLAHRLKKYVLADVSINPESRVKISTSRDRIAIPPNKWVRYLVNVENTAGITAPLRIQAVDLSKPDPSNTDWFDVEVVENPYTSHFLTGQPQEFKLVQIRILRPGLHEVRIVADAGQGTQDLGFRATADIIIDSR